MEIVMELNFDQLVDTHKLGLETLKVIKILENIFNCIL
jgi:hypothetical protein